MYYTFPFKKVIVLHSERSKESRQLPLSQPLNEMVEIIKALTPFFYHFIMCNPIFNVIVMYLRRHRT